MAAQNRRDLFLSVSADTSVMTAALKAGRSTLADFGKDANAAVDAVQQAFQKFAGGNIEAGAKALEANYNQAFAAIRAGARAVGDAPSNIAAFDILSASATREAVANAERRVDALKLLATAARQAATGDGSGDQRAYSVAADANVAAAERLLVAQRAKLGVLTAVEAQMRSMGLATREEAAAEAELAAEAVAAASAQNVLNSRGEALLRSIDPLYGAQARYNEAVATATDLRNAGVISADRYAQAEAAAALSLRQVADAAGVAAEKQMTLYASQAAAAKIEVGGDRFQEIIQSTERVRLANKSAADSFEVFRAAGLKEAQAADEISGGHQRMGASGMIAEHVIRAMSDSIAAGQSPVRALTMEMGRITEMMTMYAQTTNQTEGAFGRFASFMGGPWGLAVSVGVAVLTPLVAKLVEGADAEDAATKAAKEHKQAIDSLIKSQDAAVMTADEKLKRDWQSVDAERQKTIAIRDTIAANLELAKSNLRGAEGQTFGAAGGAGAGMAVAVYAGHLSDLEKQAAENKAAIAHLTNETRVAEGRYAKSQVEELSTPQGKIKRTFDRLESDAQKEQVRTGDVAKYTATMQELTTARQAQTKRLEESQRQTKQTARDNEQKGRPVSLNEAEDIVHSVGGRVTSRVRSTGEQQVLYDKYVAYKDGRGPWAPLAAKPGTSEHERGQALDVAKAPGMTLATLVEAFRARGVNLTERLDEGDHYHVAWGRKGKAAPTEEQLAKKREAELKKAANDDSSYQGELASAQSRYAKAQLGLADTSEKRFEIDIVELRYAQQQKIKERADKVKAGSLTAPQAATLNKIDSDTEKAAETAAYRKMIQANLDIKLAGDKREIDRQTAMLQLQDQSAQTATERRRIGLQLLALEERLLTDEANRDIASKDPERQQRGTEVLAAISAQHDTRVANVNRQTQTPMESYREHLTKNVSDMNEALDGVKANALDGLETGLLGIVSGTESVGSAFRKMANSIISDLARIAIEKLIVKIIGGGIFADGIVPGHANGIIPGFASGIIDGVIRGPGTGRSDSIFGLMGGKPIMVSNGESIMTEQATRLYGSTLKAMNDNTFPRFATGMVPDSAIYLPTIPAPLSISQRVPPPQIVYMTVDKSGLFDVHVQRAAAPLAQAAVVGGSALAQQEIGENQSRSIPV